MSDVNVNAFSHYASLPADVLDNHVWIHLSMPSLVSNSLVCKRFHKLLQNTLCYGSGSLFSNFQLAIYKELLGRGEANLIIWFQQYLNYPKLSASLKWLEGAIELAALGRPSLSSFLLEFFLYNILFVFFRRTCQYSSTGLWKWNGASTRVCCSCSSKSSSQYCEMDEPERTITKERHEEIPRWDYHYDGRLTNDKPSLRYVVNCCIFYSHKKKVDSLVLLCVLPLVEEQIGRSGDDLLRTV